MTGKPPASDPARDEGALTERLRRRLRSLTAENKELRRQARALRARAGPRGGAAALMESERQCAALREENARLGLSVAGLAGQLANEVACRTLMEEKVPEVRKLQRGPDRDPGRRGAVVTAGGGGEHGGETPGPARGEDTTQR